MMLSPTLSRSTAALLLLADLALCLAGCGEPFVALICGPGELTLERVGCQPVGVPPDACGQGFVPDGNRGCNAVLPPDVCPKGLMAVPGETACHVVSPCGPGKYGNIPVGPTTQFVDAAYAQGDSDGTAARPWRTIADGIWMAEPGAVVAVAAGSYKEDLWIRDKPVQVWGVCPARVEVVHSPGSPENTIVDIVNANGAGIHYLTISGPEYGVSVSGASDVTIDHVWIHDSGAGKDWGGGLVVWDWAGRTEVTVKDSLIEDADRLGVNVWGVDVTLTIDASVVRNTVSRANETLRSAGILAMGDIYASSSRHPEVTVRRSLIEDSQGLGIYVADTSMQLDGVVVRGTTPRVTASGEEDGWGVEIFSLQDNSIDAPVVTIERSILENNYEVGLVVIGSNAKVDATVVRGTAPNAQGSFGWGIDIQDGWSACARSSATITRSLVENNREFGVFISGSDAQIDQTRVRATESSKAGNVFGDGISVMSTSYAEATARITSVWVEGSKRVSISNFGGTVDLRSSALLACQGLHISSRSLNGFQDNFYDRGGNGCGCGEATGGCRTGDVLLGVPERLPDGHDGHSPSGTCPAP